MTPPIWIDEVKKDPAFFPYFLSGELNRCKDKHIFLRRMKVLANKGNEDSLRQVKFDLEQGYTFSTDELMYLENLGREYHRTFTAGSDKARKLAYAAAVATIAAAVTIEFPPAAISFGVLAGALSGASTHAQSQIDILEYGPINDMRSFVDTLFSYHYSSDREFKSYVDNNQKQLGINFDFSKDCLLTLFPDDVAHFFQQSYDPEKMKSSLSELLQEKLENLQQQQQAQMQRRDALDNAFYSCQAFVSLVSLIMQIKGNPEKAKIFSTVASSTFQTFHLIFKYSLGAINFGYLAYKLVNDVLTPIVNLGIENDPLAFVQQQLQAVQTSIEQLQSTMEQGFTTVVELELEILRSLADVAKSLAQFECDVQTKLDVIDGKLDFLAEEYGRNNRLDALKILREALLSPEGVNSRQRIYVHASDYAKRNYFSGGDLSLEEQNMQQAQRVDRLFGLLPKMLYHIGITDFNLQGPPIPNPIELARAYIILQEVRRSSVVSDDIRINGYLAELEHDFDRVNSLIEIIGSQSTLVAIERAYRETVQQLLTSIKTKVLTQLSADYPEPKVEAHVATQWTDGKGKPFGSPITTFLARSPLESATFVLHQNLGENIFSLDVGAYNPIEQAQRHRLITVRNLRSHTRDSVDKEYKKNALRYTNTWSQITECEFEFLQGPLKDLSILFDITKFYTGDYRESREVYCLKSGSLFSTFAQAERLIEGTAYQIVPEGVDREKTNFIMFIHYQLQNYLREQRQIRVEEIIAAELNNSIEVNELNKIARIMRVFTQINMWQQFPSLFPVLLLDDLRDESCQHLLLSKSGDYFDSDIMLKLVRNIATNSDTEDLTGQVDQMVEHSICRYRKVRDQAARGTLPEIGFARLIQQINFPQNHAKESSTKVSGFCWGTTATSISAGVTLGGLIAWSLFARKNSSQNPSTSGPSNVLPKGPNT